MQSASPSLVKEQIFNSLQALPLHEEYMWGEVNQKLSYGVSIIPWGKSLLLSSCPVIKGTLKYQDTHAM